MAIQSQEGVLRERITALLKGELIQVQPIGERENPETKSSGTGVPTPSMSENPGEGLSFPRFFPLIRKRGGRTRRRRYRLSEILWGKRNLCMMNILSPLGTGPESVPWQGKSQTFLTLSQTSMN